MARLCGAKKVIAIDYLGLPVGAAVFGARRHDVGAGRTLLDELLPNHPRVTDVLADRGFRGLQGPIAREHLVNVEIKHRDRLPGEFEPIRPSWRVEDAFAELGRWRRLARSFEATPASATAWVQVACVGWMLALL
ncbi:transposase [Nitriliruptor alkaliphilus]|uniref:transposase n=1 Tax=Nitriliruptor alkaliphilus TaxID=427918 RepID=UPI000697D182|nr:transposase [Nitriliruptor alkaliphilus]